VVFDPNGLRPHGCGGDAGHRIVGGALTAVEPEARWYVEMQAS
jgi:hypothetical protein